MDLPEERALLVRIPEEAALALREALGAGTASVTRDASDAARLRLDISGGGAVHLRRARAAPFLATLKPGGDGGRTYYHGPPVDGVYVLDTPAKSRVGVRGSAPASASASAAAAMMTSSPALRDARSLRFASCYTRGEIGEAERVLLELSASTREKAGYDHVSAELVDAEPWMAPFLSQSAPGDHVTLVYEEGVLVRGGTVTSGRDGGEERAFAAVIEAAAAAAAAAVAAKAAAAEAAAAAAARALIAAEAPAPLVLALTAEEEAAAAFGDGAGSGGEGGGMRGDALAHIIAGGSDGGEDGVFDNEDEGGGFGQDGGEEDGFGGDVALLEQEDDVVVPMGGGEGSHHGDSSYAFAASEDVEMVAGGGEGGGFGEEGSGGVAQEELLHPALAAALSVLAEAEAEVVRLTGLVASATLAPTRKRLAEGLRVAEERAAAARVGVAAARGEE